MKRKRLGELLIQANVITEAQLMEALKEQKNTRQRLGDQLIAMNFVNEDTIIEVLQLQLGLQKINLYEFNIDRKLINLINGDIARKHQVLPLRQTRDRLLVAMSDPLDYFAIDDLSLSTGFQVETAIAKKDEIRVMLNRYYGMEKSIDKAMEDIPVSEVEENILGDTDDSPVARMIDQLLGQAVQVGASDIHIDPHETETVIRLRVDGVLRTERTLPNHMNNFLVSRIKVLAKLNIAEKRLPQDGRFQKEYELRTIDLRVSILPTVFGEKVVLRLLDTGNVNLGIDKLGLSKLNEDNFRKMINHAYGIILVTGPTGSGKSTTLYTALQKLNTEEVNIITVEDPVEYQMKGINQVQARPSIGMTFANSLRTILRQDPDIIMVGEIRDTETAEIALRSALTGHLVLSTLHTNDAVSAISRLIDMEIEPFLVSSAVVGVVGQRLVRKVCRFCASPNPLTTAEMKLFLEKGLPTDKVVKGKGCPACNKTGFQGRLAIHETLLVDDDIRKMITKKDPDALIRDYLSTNNFIPMFLDGLQKVAEGLTTLEEIYRVSVDR